MGEEREEGENRGKGRREIGRQDFGESWIKSGRMEERIGIEGGRKDEKKEGETE